MRLIWVIGSGGHAKVVIDALRASGECDVAGILDDAPERWGAEVLGVPVRGEISERSIVRLAIESAVIAIGSNSTRAEVARRFGHRLSWSRAVHPTAYLAPGVRLGEGSVVLAGAIIQPDTVIGDHAILNTMCSVDHDGVIGDFTHVGPGAHLAGNVRVGEGAFLGVGSCVVPGRLVDAWSTVGAGGVVVTDIPRGAIAKGVPARFAGG